MGGVQEHLVNYNEDSAWHDRQAELEVILRNAHMLQSLTKESEANKEHYRIGNIINQFNPRASGLKKVNTSFNLFHHVLLLNRNGRKHESWDQNLGDKQCIEQWHHERVILLFQFVSH